MSLAEGERAILDSMSGRRSLAALGSVEHEYPHCWKCACPLITRATEQWFVKIDRREKPDQMTLRERALLEIKITNWMPASARERIRGMIENRPDWCISRQRFWGVPIPALLCRGCGKEILDPDVIKKIRDIVGAEKDSDILDVWFEAGTSWQVVLVTDHRLSFPADLCVEGSDQHRGWFQLSLFPALVSRGKAPYRSVLTHGRRRARKSSCRHHTVVLRIG
jgi:isoleucyl-tRNA synthetase